MSTPRVQAFRSSGDVRADRRHAYARDHFEAGETAIAVEVMEQALELTPDWAAGWFELATFREGAGDRDGAVDAFEEAVARDPEDHCGAGLALVRLGARTTPPSAPAAHVRDLFDGYAAHFEASLVGGLGYRAPALLAAAIETARPGGRFAACLDLGCGTGLMGEAIRARVDRLVGVDLAAAMVAIARDKAIYDELAVGEIVADLAGRPAGAFDLVTAADVFCYLGDLGPVFAAVARVLAPGGLFAFSVERAGDSETTAPALLRDSHRWAHRRDPLVAAAAALGLDLAVVEEAALRRDRGSDIVGLVVAVTKPSDSARRS